MSGGDYRVADISLADFGRKEINVSGRSASLKARASPPREGRAL